MRRWRRVAAGAGLAILVVLAAPGPAAAVTYVGLHDLTCDGVTTEGTGLPASTRLDVALVDPVSRRTLARGQPTTSAAGAFEWREMAGYPSCWELLSPLDRGFARWYHRCTHAAHASVPSGRAS